MLLKKLVFLMLPLVIVYMRSATAQQATRWLFRGVVPKDGTLGKVISELREPPHHPGGTTHASPERRKSTAARIADNWPVFLAFVAGVAVTAILMARLARSE